MYLLMKERAITGKILSSIRDDARFGSCAVEVKVARGSTLYKGQLKEHQWRALTLANTHAVYWKIGDEGYGQKPFDGFILKKTEAYLVVYFPVKPRAEIWAVPIKEMPIGASLTIARARSIGINVRL